MTPVNVTAQHLAKGTPGNCTACAAVLAIEDAFPHATDVTVGQRYISMRHQGQWVLLTMPLSAAERITAIDRGKPVEPFTFDLDYPAEAS